MEKEEAEKKRTLQLITKTRVHSGSISRCDGGLTPITLA